MSPGFDRPSRRVAIKNCRTFRCRGSTIVSRSYSISFPLFFTFSSLFFSRFVSSSCVRAFITPKSVSSNQLLVSWQNPVGKIERRPFQLYRCPLVLKLFESATSSSMKPLSRISVFRGMLFESTFQTTSALYFYRL